MPTAAADPTPPYPARPGGWRSDPWDVDVQSRRAENPMNSLLSRAPGLPKGGPVLGPFWVPFRNHFWGPEAHFFKEIVKEFVEEVFKGMFKEVFKELLRELLSKR